MGRIGKSNFLRICLLLGILLAAAAVLQAQPYGRVTGRVVSSESGEYLVGANVFLKGTPLGAATDREGRYSIENVAAGAYTLTVNYIGYETFSTEVSVASGSTLEQNIKLKVSYVQGQEVVVHGLREGQIKALSQQRTSPSIENVVAEEQMQRFPDLNTAEVLQRIPAVSLERDQGEGRYVQIRGTEARLSSVSVNGERIASPEGGERFVGMDVISASQVTSIEVVKAITPDQDGDAIGGSVNMVTRSAFDSDRPFLNITAGGGSSHQLGKPMYQGVFTYGARFGSDQKWGFTLSGNIYRSIRSTWDNEMDWGSVDDTQDNEIPWALKNLDLRDYIVERIRSGVAADLEFRPSANNRFFIRGMFNNRDDNELRRRLRVRVDKGKYTDTTHITGSRFYRELKDRLERQNIMSLTGGGLHKMGNWNLDYTVAYSFAKMEKPDETDPLFELNKKPNLTLDLSNTSLPTYQVVGLASGYEQNSDNYKMSEVRWNNDENTDNDILTSFNLKRSYLLGGLPSELKFGGKAHMRTNDRDNTRWIYKWTGSTDFLLTPYVGDTGITILDDAYTIGPAVDSDKFRTAFKADKDGLFQGTIDHPNSDAAKFKADENLYAYYAMNTLNVGNLMVLAGLRHEFTKVENQCNDVKFDSDGNYVSTTPVNNAVSYNNLLPMLHLRYRLTPMTNLRAAFTTGVARPNFYDLVPYRIQLPADQNLRLGNPDLKPTTATNLDFMAEYYFKGIGIVSGGVFHKSLKNIIYGTTDRIEGGEFDGYEVEQPVNGGSSTLFGYEINWQQQLTFLPGILNGLGLYINYTHTESEAELGGRLERSILPGQAGSIANFAISYEKWGFTGRFSVNYHGSFLSEVGEDTEHDIFYKKHTQMDFSASQKIYKGVQLYFEALNLNNEPMIYYMGNESRPVQREFYSWWFHSGIKFNR